MSVTFQNVLLKNSTGIDNIPLTIEVPIGNPVYGPSPVKANANVDIDISRDNCLSVRLRMDDPDHGATQDFVLASPGKGRPSYLETVEAIFNVGDITGSAKARTGDY
jgi:hypothetical protein